MDRHEFSITVEGSLSIFTAPNGLTAHVTMRHPNGAYITISLARPQLVSTIRIIESVIASIDTNLKQEQEA